MEERYLQETKMLDFSSPEIEKLVTERGWRSLPPFGRVKSIYSFVRDEILFGYNTDDSIPASCVLSDGCGQCNTKSTLFMALLRACSIECRIHGFTIHKRLQKGAMTGLVYLLAPENVFHSWVEVHLGDRWYITEGIILDERYLSGLRRKFPPHAGPFVGYGVAVKDWKDINVDFDGNDTFIQSEGINGDFGVYDSPDDLLSGHGQEMSHLKAFVYRHIGRHLMNRNVGRTRGCVDRE
jgi:hypothetical protein